MGYDELVCAACSGRVLDGGCPTCRASRRDLTAPRLPADALLLIALALMLVLVLMTSR